MGLINTFDYKEELFDKIKSDNYDNNWPVVYILRNSKEAYIGETTRVYNRCQEHYKNKDRRKLTLIDIISDFDFNKSATLEIESLLIEYMAADGKYSLQNGNGGLTNHNYYNKDNYEKSLSIYGRN